MAFFRNISNWLAMLFRVWRREFWLVIHDQGVLIFFLLLPTLYPIVYTLIYNPEIVEKLPIAVVDQSRTAASRELIRTVGATQSISVDYFPPTLAEARERMNSHDVFGVMVIPEDYARRLGGGEQAVVPFYSDMSLLIRYRAYLQTLTNLEISLGSAIQIEKIDAAGLLGTTLVGGNDATPLEAESIMLGDPTSGFASFVIPGILVLILQQSMVLGVLMLGGAAASRRRRNGGIDPLAIPAPPGASLLGRMLCYLAIYIPLIIYILEIVPNIFSLPHMGNPWHYLMLILPMMIASVFFGETLSPLVTERESSFAVFVVSSVIFLFLSGLTWPRFSMNGFWYALGSIVPATWGLEGFVRMNSNGADIASQQTPLLMLWGLAILYFITAYLLTRYRLAPARRLRHNSSSTISTPD
ncbi:MAG: ABC transporter permease [Clostridium sp.]|nr:ABC transporter permease [Clostridium sp.]